MRVGVIDVGSNTVRLLVAVAAGRGVEAVHEERALLGLGAEVARHGRLSDGQLLRTSRVARSYAAQARRLGCEGIDMVVTAPGRQSANGEELVRMLARATGTVPRVLAPEEEGRLAWLGAVAPLASDGTPVAVCDVGGGSTEIAIGPAGGDPEWVASVDIGSQSLTQVFLAEDPPGKRASAAATTAVAGAFARLSPPPARVALATGGTARALRRLTGTRVLGADDLAGAGRRLGKRHSDALAEEHAIDPGRARTLTAGTLILAEVQRLLGTPLQVARGGLREGAALELLARVSRAA